MKLGAFDMHACTPRELPGTCCNKINSSRGLFGAFQTATRPPNLSMATKPGSVATNSFGLRGIKAKGGPQSGARAVSSRIAKRDGED